MPIRFLKPGLAASDKWNALPWREQSLYVRLITWVDDYGRFEANPILVRSHSFPTRDDVSAKETGLMLELLHDEGLITLYEKGGKRYGQMENWTERVRSKFERYPNPRSHGVTLIPRKKRLTPAPEAPPAAPAAPALALEQEAAPKPPPEQEPPPAEPKPSASLKRQLTDLWCERFKARMGYAYPFAGAKDGKAADQLLKLGIPVLELVLIAEEAWQKSGDKFFWCKHAKTMAGFASSFVNIRSELGHKAAPSEQKKGGF